MRVQAGGDSPFEIAQERELCQLEERVAKLHALLVYFTQRLGCPDVGSGLSHSEFYDYSRLVQEHVDAVLIYEKVARQWPGTKRQHVKHLIERAIAAHEDLSGILQEECRLLARKIANVDRSLKWNGSGRPSAHNARTGQIFNLEG